MASVLSLSELQLLLLVMVHPKLTEDVACSLIKIFAQLACNHLIFVKVALHVVVQIISRFTDVPLILESVQQMVEASLTLIQNQDIKKTRLF